MQNITIDTGELHLTVNSDPRRVITFNPNDIIFVEHFYKLFDDFNKKMNEYKERSIVIDAIEGDDANGLPLAAPQRLALLREACTYMREQIDYLFGPGTAQAAFQDAMTLTMFEGFFNAVTPYIKKERAAKIAQYTTPASAKRNRHKSK